MHPASGILTPRLLGLCPEPPCPHCAGGVQGLGVSVHAGDVRLPVAAPAEGAFLCRAWGRVPL